MDRRQEGSSSWSKISTLFKKHWSERFPEWYSIFVTILFSCIGAISIVLIVSLLEADFYKVSDTSYTYSQNFFDLEGLDPRPFWNSVKITGMTDKTDCGTAPAWASSYCSTLESVGFTFINDEDAELGTRDDPTPKYFQIDEGNIVRWATIILRQRPAYYVFLTGTDDIFEVLDVNQEFAYVLDIIDRPSDFTDYDSLVNGAKVSVKTTPYNETDYDRLIMSWWIAYTFGFLLGFFLTWDVVNVVWYIGKERQKGTKDLMTFLGLNQTQYWISHFLAYLAQQFVPFLVCFIVLVTSYQKMDDVFNFEFDAGTYVYVFWVLLTAVVNIGLFGFASSAFLTTDNVHDAWGWITSLVLQYVPSLVMLYGFNNEGVGTRFILQFIPLMNFYFGLRDSILGVQADTVFFSIFNFFLWGGLTFYFDLVIPTAKGTQMRPCCFCFQSSVPSDSAVASEELQADNPAVGSEDGTVLHIRDLVRKFDNVTAVDGVNLSLKGDQIFGLLGFNGAGKTTTISMITGILPSTSGKIFVHGKDIATELESLRQQMSICPQVNILWDELTVGEHLKLFGRLRGIADDTIETQTAQFLEELGMSHCLNNRSKNLSGGEKRKLMIIQAFIGDPEFILLDEPTSGVDPDSAKQIQDLIIRHKAGKLIILTTHHMEEADFLSDEIAIMADGKIMVRDTPTELKMKYGRGTVLEIAPNSIDEAALENFDVDVVHSNDMTEVLIKQEKDILDALKAIQTDKIHIKNNSLESVFLNLARERAASRAYDENFSTSGIDVRAIEYKRPGCFAKFVHLVKNRLCIQWKNTGPFVLAVALLLIVAVLSFVGQVSFGFKNTPSNWPSVSDVGKLNVYGTGPLFSSALAQFGVQKSGSLPLKSFVQDTPNKVAVEHVSNDLVNVYVDPFYTGDGSVAVSLLFRETGTSIKLNDEIALGNLIASYFNTFYFIIGSGAVVACIYKYTRLEIEERRLEMQMLMGVPYWLFFLTNFLWDYILVVIAAIIYMTVVAYDVPEDIRDGTASMAVAATGFLFFTYTIGKFFTLQRLVVAFFGINFGVSIGITIINFNDNEWLRKTFEWEGERINWDKGLSKTELIIIQIVMYFMPAGQFFLSQMFFLYKTWIPGVAISQTRESLHWFFCWIGNFCWILLFFATEKNWFGDPAVSQLDPATMEAQEQPQRDANGIVVDKLSKVYKDAAGMPLIAVRNVSFNVAEGRCFGLLGKNGAGKSTLINMLTTLTRPTYGKGFVKGLDVVENANQVRDIIGKCDQENIYWEYFTAREHLRYFGILKGVPEDIIDDLIVQYAVQLKFAEFLDTLCGQLSGGNKRKVALCTAVIGDCSVYFLDEPSAGVDPFARDEMRKVIEECKKGRLCIFTSHVMEEAELMCDDVFIMVRGEVQVSGQLNDLIQELSEGYYFRVNVADLTPEQIEELRQGVEARLEITKTRRDKRELIFLIPLPITLREIFEVALETKERYECNFLVESSSLGQLFLRLVSPEERTQSISVEEDDNQQAVEMQPVV